MKNGETFVLKNRFKDQPKKDSGLRAMTEVIAKKNSIRILVNSTGAFPMHPTTLEETSGNG